METLFRDRLPKGLSFPLGIEALSKGAPALEAFCPVVLFTWQSTWASQLHDPIKGRNGQLSILHLLSDMPVMRINENKVRERPPQSRIVITEYAVSSSHRRLVLDKFLLDGGKTVSKALTYWPFEGMVVRFDLEEEAFVLPKELANVR